jgi:uncharacterized protein YuzE
MRIRYDRRVDAAYITLGDAEILAGGVSRTVGCDPLREMINLDFDHQGYLVGIEVIDASKKLSPELLRTASGYDVNGPGE